MNYYYDSRLNCIDCLVIPRDLFFLQAWNFLSRLPILNISLSIKGCWDDAVQPQNEVPVPLLTTDTRDDKRWIKLHADQEYVLQINLQRTQMGYQVDKFIISFPTAEFSIYALHSITIFLWFKNYVNYKHFKSFFCVSSEADGFSGCSRTVNRGKGKILNQLPSMKKVCHYYYYFFFLQNRNS